MCVGPSDRCAVGSLVVAGSEVGCSRLCLSFLSMGAWVGRGASRKRQACSSARHLVTCCGDIGLTGQLDRLPLIYTLYVWLLPLSDAEFYVAVILLGEHCLQGLWVHRSSLPQYFTSDNSPEGFMMSFVFPGFRELFTAIFQDTDGDQFLHMASLFFFGGGATGDQTHDLTLKQVRMPLS